MNTILNKPAFSFRERTYTWGDVVLAAMVRGDWAALEAQVCLGLALAERAGEADELPSEEELDAAAQEFRYARDLVTAEEMESWLDRCDLTLDEWMDYIARLLLRQSEADPSDDALLKSFEPEEVGANVIVEAICSGELQRLAETLAGRAAIIARADGGAGEDTVDPGALERSVERASRSLARSGIGLAADSSRETIREMARLELLFERASRRVLTDEAIRAQIETHRLDWIRLEIRDLGFPEEPAAKEAALCVREDGASLDAVAADAHIPLRDASLYLDDADPDARPALLSAGPNDLVGPLALADGFHLVLVRGKIMPTPEDSGVRERAQETLLARLSEQETAAGVRWLDRL